MKRNTASCRSSSRMLTCMRVFFAVLATIFILACVVSGLCLIFQWPQALLHIILEHGNTITLLSILCALLAIFCVIFYSALMRRSLRAANREYQLLANNLPGGICKCTANGAYEFLYISDGFLKMLGYTAEEIRLQFHNSSLALVHPADRERIAAQLMQEAASSEALTLEYRVVTKEGKTLWLLDRLSRLHDERDAEVYYSVRIDNTAKKEADMLLHVRNELIRIAMEHSRSHIYEYNIATRSFDSIMRPPHSTHPLLPEHIQSMPDSLIDSGFVSSETADGFRAAFHAIADGVASAACLISVKNEAGNYDCWLNVALTTVFDGFGAPVCAVSTLEDVTEQKHAQERYDKAKRHYDAMCSSTLASILFDVETGTILSARAHSSSAAKLLPEGTNLEACLPELARRTVLLGERAEFLRTLTLPNLRKHYEEGRNFLFEYRTMPEGGLSTAWRQIAVNMERDPASGMLTGFAFVTDIDAQKRKELDLQHKAEHDPLTGLWNRRALKAQIQEFLESHDAQNGLHAFYIIDMDDFKSVNDTYGHTRGDAMLCAIADQLRGTFRKTDIIARLAGDEFVVFMKNADTEARIAGKAQEICTRIQSITLGDPKLPPPRASIGIAIAPDAGSSFETLYAHADAAHYVAKRSGKNRYAFFQQAEQAEEKIQTTMPYSPGLPLLK